ncbi:MAG: AraC family transcriptional regulator N-terminal domain-containing protein, partial [Pseudomonadales bacterium]|nr:AraC family transcriptional regulator N-terminal domain-containing protein [Pseudomonadales bacterium]
MNRLKPRQTPKTLVENRISFAGPNAELSLYDTYLPAQHVDLAAGELLYCGMISGRKILHGRNDYHAEFFPQESFVMAPGEQIQIDFPDASLQSPTSCLTIEISQSRIDQICDQLNHRSPMQTDFDTWQYRHYNVLHSPHTQATQAL